MYVVFLERTRQADCTNEFT